MLTLPKNQRSRICLGIGTAAIASFFVLRGWNLFGDPRPWVSSDARPNWIAMLSVNKYPASLLFVLMTLGPAIALLPILDRAQGTIGQLMAQFGRVPLFFYILHIPLIHGMAVAISWVRTPAATSWLFGDHPVTRDPVPDGYPWGLPLLYLVTSVCLIIFGFACRAYENKQN